MGIQMYIYAAILAVGLAMGGTIAYKIEHAQVLSMELKIANQKVEAAQLLAVETQKVVDAESAQAKLNIQLDKEHAKLKEISAAYDSKLTDAINGLRFTTSGQSSSSTSTEGSGTGINQTNDSDFTYISRGFLEFLKVESARADQAAIDKNTLLEFVQQNNCGIPK